VLLMTPLSVATEMSQKDWSGASAKVNEGRVSILTPMSLETEMSSKQRGGGSGKSDKSMDSREAVHRVDLLTPMSMATLVDRDSGEQVPLRPAAPSAVAVETPTSVNTEEMLGDKGYSADASQALDEEAPDLADMPLSPDSVGHVKALFP